MAIPDKFTGFQVNSSETWTEFHKNEFDPKPFGDYDVDIKIECCEIVGTALRVGPKVTLIKPGQRVGVGAQSYSCLDCRQCKNENETYCKKQLDTYGAKWPDTGIPARPQRLRPRQKVGIVGIGGLGHFGVLFAKALGAEVWAISRTRAKEEDAKKMGATGLIATNEEGWSEPHSMTFDLIVNTANSFDGFQLSEYLSLLDVHGKWVSVGLPGGDGITIKNQDFLPNGCFIGSSHLGSRREMLEMLQLAADQKIKTWLEEVPISADNLKSSLLRLEHHDIKYRFCLTNYEDAFGK
ncbi:unnamed protein product [Parascedosporium putredinis]|uniref:alcohol dehydrogenase (NADP(+)) n=1 Tax=Parascedosporium putredinis TaxID=1442378 RepID=A0A9P1H7A5_9PEZI|nr:unnamed protein product [Parascedosporium putredinis]CAI8001068.1 unnamed protein product [Parascedosporium putredinis]